MKFEVKRDGIHVLTFHLHHSGEWWFRPTVEIHREAMASLRHNEHGRYTARHYFVVNCVQIFWLKFIFAVSIHRQFLSEDEVMNYNETVDYEINSLSKPLEP